MANTKEELVTLTKEIAAMLRGVDVNLANDAGALYGVAATLAVAVGGDEVSVAVDEDLVDDEDQDVDL